MPRKTIVIYDGDDFERLAELRTQVAVAERAADAAAKTPLRAGDVVPGAESIKAAQDAFDAFVDEAAERAEKWVLQSIGHEAWRELVRAHPPRMVTHGEGDDAKEVEHPEDAGTGVNTETFGKALLLFVDPDDDEHRTVVEAGDADLSRLGSRLRRLSEGQFETLWSVAYQLNVGGIADPKLARFSPDVPRSSET